MVRLMGYLLALASLCPQAFSGIEPRNMMIDFENGLRPFVPEDWEYGSIWKNFSYDDLAKELNGTVPRPPDGGGERMARLDIKGTSAGSFMTLPAVKPMTGLTMIFDYFLHSSLDRAAGIWIEYQKGYSGYKNLAEFYAPQPHDGSFHTATANITLAEPSCITIRVYGNGDGGSKPDIVAIDNFRIKVHIAPLEMAKEGKDIEGDIIFFPSLNCPNTAFSLEP